MPRTTFLLLIPSLVLAQAPPPPASIERLIPVHTAPDDSEGGAYGIWGGGPGYKVSFHDGFAMQPLVGPLAAAPVVVRWRTTGCRIGASALPVAEAVPAPRWSAHRVEFDHGAFVEAYDLRADGVEQTFVFAERPEGSGDLVVEGVFDGLAPAAEDAASGELRFAAADGVPRVCCGAATAVDADGDTCAMRRTCRGGQIALVLDATWLDRATFPVVVDPLLRPNTALGFSRRVVDVDVFRDDRETEHEVWLATTVEDTATGDRDLIVQRVRADFSEPRDVFLDVTTNWKTSGGRLAGIGGIDKVVAVFTRELGTGLLVRWHVHEKASFAVSTSVGGVTRPAGTHDSRPDVGGSDAFAIGRNALLAWQRDVSATPGNTLSSRVLVATLDTSGTGQGVLGTQVLLEASGTGDDDAPSVNQEAEGGTAFSWAVAWLRDESPPSSGRRVAVRLVDQAGLPTAARFDVPTGFPLHGQGAPQIAGRDGRYLIAHGMRGDVTNGFHELVTVRLDWPHGAANGVRPYAATSIEASNLVDGHLHGLAFDTLSRCHWVLTRRDAAFDQLRVYKVGFTGRAVELEDLPLPGNTVPRASAVSFDDDAGRFVVAVAVQPLLPSQPSAVHLDAMLYEPVAAIAQYGTACGAGRLAWSGSQHLGDEFTMLTLLQGRPQSPSFVALALASANVDLAFLGMPGCFLLCDAAGPSGVGTVALASDAGGRLDLRLPLPENLAPMVLHAQVFQLAPGSNAAGVVATRGLQVGLGR